MSDQQIPPMDLSKCCDCNKQLVKGQEYWELYREKKHVMSFCIDCHGLYTEEKKVWGK